MLGLVARDLTNTQIARRLHLSGKTVERHVSAVIRKLAVADRTAAVAEGHRIGVLDPPT